MSDRETRQGEAPGTGPEAGTGSAAEDPVERLLRCAGPRPAVPAERMERACATVREHWRRTIAGSRRGRRLVWGAAAVTAAAASLLLVMREGLVRRTPLPPPAATAILERVEGAVRWEGAAPPSIGGPVPPGLVLDTAGGGRAAIRLAGGVALRVDAGTLLRLAWGGGLLLDRGGIYLDTGAAVVPDASGAPDGPSGTVVIETPLGVVRDRGTQFQVRAAPDVVRVSVREGAAMMERDGVTHEAAPGTEIIVGPAAGVSRRPVPSTGPEWDWILEVAPPFDLEGSNLRDYLEWIVRETGVRVEYGDPSIGAGAAAVVLHGSIEGLRPDATLGAVLPTCGLTHRILGDVLMVERAAPGAAP
ncbi:MAG: FecR domain-containing protein [Candidatus Polarisedimenticolia bacterium]